MTELNAAVLADLWKHAKANQTPKEPYLQAVLKFMMLHEALHAHWDRLQADPTVPLVVEGENLVVHIAMDAATEKAIQDDRPEGLRDLYQELVRGGIEEGRAFHVLSRAMAEEFLLAGELEVEIDFVRYFARAKEYARLALENPKDN
jgi:hypothetical protein